jgi:acyl-CoA thioester hydrolase
MRHRPTRFNPCPDPEVKRDTIAAVYEKQIEIRWRDLDAYRHVNNAVYATYLEECRDELVDNVLSGSGDAWDFVLARVAINYRRELTQADDAVVVRCVVESLGTSSITLREEIRTLAGELATEAEAVLVARDPETGRSRPLTEAERTAFERFRSAG